MTGNHDMVAVGDRHMTGNHDMVAVGDRHMTGNQDMTTHGESCYRHTRHPCGTATHVTA